jgi:hypothetical protein
MIARHKCTVLFGVVFAILFNGCESRSKERLRPTLGQTPPQNVAFQLELQYLHTIEKLTPLEKQQIETELEAVEKTLGVPKPVLWCILFQESRFDVFKNALNTMSAKGLGQFTSSATHEINHDTNTYDSRTRTILESEIEEDLFPIGFDLKLKPTRKKLGSKKRTLPEQSVHSYYHTKTAVFSSAAYLNNRYREIKQSLERQGLQYDSQLLWLYAAAAYNKGARTVFALLTHEYMTRGEGAVKELLFDLKAAQDLLTQKDRLEYPLREIWDKKTRKRYVDELQRNMKIVSSCAFSEKKL